MRKLLRGLAWTIGWLTALGAFANALLSFFRWEWHRALVAALLFVAVEVALATALLLRRAERSASARGRPDGEPPQWRVRPSRAHEFPWLDGVGGDRFGVFIPLLLGSGVLVSAIAWVVERIATGTTGSGGDDASGAPEGFEEIALTAHSLVPSDDEVRVRGLPATDDVHVRALLGPFAPGPSTEVDT